MEVTVALFDTFQFDQTRPRVSIAADPNRSPMSTLPAVAVPTHKADSLAITPSWRAGDWKSHGVDCPFAFRVNGRRAMTVVGWDGVGYQSGISWHEDGTWSEPELCFPRDPESAHRRYNAALTGLLREHALDGDGELIQVDGYYIGTYHAYPDPGYEQGSAIIGIVRSRDLRTWEDHGELLHPGEGGWWERGGLYKSHLILHEGRYWLFYNAKDQAEDGWIEQTGAAVSDDLLTWHRVSDQPLLPVGGPGEPDSRFASDPFIVRDADGTWVMFYFGLGATSPARELAATSTDLITWTKSGRILVDAGPAGSIDDWHAHKPTVIRDGNRLEHYYCAVQRLEEPVTIDGGQVHERRGIALAWSLFP